MSIKMTGIIAGILILSVIPFSFADYDEKLAFAGSLEETLGHFWAIEKNLDDHNAELALVHATHPIAELYDSMKPELKEANPEFDAKVQKTLMDLRIKTGPDVTREDAQAALDEAKSIIEEARILVVGEETSKDTAFRAKLIQGLLETSIGEYEEGVSNGQIEMMAEFQDGSAFVWRSQQIFDEIKQDLPEHDASEIDEMYSNLWDAYSKHAEPEDVAAIANGIINKVGQAIGEEIKEVDLLSYVDNIHSLLNQAREKYAAGDHDASLSLATKAYLDNFEYLEGPVGKSDPELVDDLESMMRIELRDMIKDNASPDDVSKKIDDILAKMDSVAKIVPEFGSVAAMILIIGIVSTIVIVAKHKNLVMMPKF